MTLRSIEAADPTDPTVDPAPYTGIRFVAGFIGSPKMNFVDGQEAGRHGAALIGVRPEHLAVTREAGYWRGQVSVAENLGSDTFLHVEVPGMAPLVARAPGEYRCIPATRSG